MTVWEGFRVWLLSGLRELKPLDWSQRKVTFMAKTTWTFGKKEKKKTGQTMTSNVKVVYVQPQHDLLLIRGESHKSRDRKMSTDKKTWRKFVLLFFQWELIRSVLLSTVNQDNELGLNHHYKWFWRADWHWGSLHQCCVSVNPLIVLLRCRNGKMCVYTEWTVYLKTRIRSLSNHPDADGKIPKTRERDLPISAYLGVKLLPRSLCDTQRSDLCWSCSHKCLRTELLWGCSEPFLTPGLTNAFSSAL